MKITKLLWVVAAFALLAGQVGAKVININFAKWFTTNANVVADGPGQGVLDDTGTIGAWNNPFRTGTVTDLIDSDGNVTDVGVDVGFNGTYQGGGVTPVVLNDYLFLDSGSVTNSITQPIVFNNLTAGVAYDIAFMGQGINLEEDARFAIGGTSKTITPVDLNSSVWEEGENYVLFSDVEADADGLITGEWSNVSSRYASLGGIQIAAIPEPATFGLVATFGGALFFLRRRSRRFMA